jgi:hypothetical protein
VPTDPHQIVAVSAVGPDGRPAYFAIGEAVNGRVVTEIFSLERRDRQHVEVWSGDERLADFDKAAVVALKLRPLGR